MKKIKNKKGFTLIELIVVMAVIGILVLLAAPKFLGYTKDANVTAMQSDAKILSNAALMYNIDNETFPVAWTDAGAPGNGVRDAGEEDTAPAVATLNAGLKAYLVDLGFDEANDTVALIEASDLNAYVKNIKDGKLAADGTYENYVLVTSGTLEGEVFHATGVENKEGKIQYGIVENTK